MTIKPQSRMPDKPGDMAWADFLDRFQDLVAPYYWTFGLKETMRFTGVSSSNVIMAALDRWDARSPNFRHPAIIHDDAGPDQGPTPKESLPSKPTVDSEGERVTTPSGHVEHQHSQTYWRGRHDGFREAALAFTWWAKREEKEPTP